MWRMWTESEITGFFQIQGLGVSLGLAWEVRLFLPEGHYAGHGVTQGVVSGPAAARKQILRLLVRIR